MKRGWRVFWAACGICAGIGLICCMASLVLGVTTEAVEARFPGGIRVTKNFGIMWRDNGSGWSWGIGPRWAVEEDEKASFSGVRSIDADVGALEIIVQPADEGEDGLILGGGEVFLEAEDIPKRLELRYYMEGDELKIRSTESIKGLTNLGFVGTLTLRVPTEKPLERASFNNAAGTLYIEDIRARELVVDVGAGEADIDGFVSEKVDLACGAGTIHASGDARAGARIECGIGEVVYEAFGRQNDYNYNLECGIGEITCGSDEYAGLNSTRKIDTGAAKDINVECGIGSVEISFSEE